MDGRRKRVFGTPRVDDGNLSPGQASPGMMEHTKSGRDKHTLERKTYVRVFEKNKRQWRLYM